MAACSRELGGKANSDREISEAVDGDFLRRLREIAGTDALLDSARRWRNEPARVPLGRLRAQATRIAERSTAA